MTPPDAIGFEVAVRMSGRARPPDMVLVSSRDGSDYGSRIQRSPAVGFISKSDLSASALRKLLAVS